MQSLTIELSEIILSHLPDEQFMKMVNDPYLSPYVLDVYKSNVFWKRKLESRFGYHLENMQSLDWKDLYYYIGNDINIFFIFVCNCGDTKVVQSLLKRSEIITFVYDNSAINAAAYNGHTEVVSLLVKDSRMDYVHDDVLDSACSMGHISTVKTLLESPKIKITPDEDRALMSAVANGHVDVVEVLLKDARFCPSNNVLKQTVHYGHTTILDILIKDTRVDPSFDNNCLLRTAFINDHTEIVDLLLRYPSVDSSNFPNYQLQKAAKNGQVDAVLSMLKQGAADPSENYNHAINLAAQYGHLNVIVDRYALHTSLNYY